MSHELKGGGRYGIDGVRGAVQAADAPTAAATAMAIHREVGGVLVRVPPGRATLIVLAVD
ncbi:MAG: hypothetical protein ACXWZZ_04705 [Solirubrobacteraceae bacterium]